jgi:hypothetical protein
MVTQPGFGLRPLGMDWNYGHTAWFSSTASGHGLALRSHSLVWSTASKHGLGLQPGLAVRPQGMDWDYGHTTWFRSTASGHGLGVHNHRVWGGE